MTRIQPLLLVSVVAVLFAGVTGSIGEVESKFRLIRIWPKTREEISVIRELYNASSELDLDFWKAPTAVGAFVDVMLGPQSFPLTERMLTENGIAYRVTVDDIQKRILEKETSSGQAKEKTDNPLLISFFKRAKDFSTRNRAKYQFGEYHSYDDMLRWMDDIQRFYPNLAQTFVAGTTHEGRPIKGIKIGSPVYRTDKRAVWIDGGIHAREWAAIHTALYFIERLIADYNVDPEITAYVDNLNFYILPVANPDGFEYSRSDVSPQTRFWRKNRGHIVCEKDRWHRNRCCGGVDLNRNFDFHFGESGSSSDSCSDIYQGTAAFSEPESRAIRDKLLSPELYGKVDGFITLHTYSQMWIHPFNHERRSFPADIDDLQDVGKRGVAAIEAMYGTKFRFGTGADILYPSAGGSDDWAKAKAGIKYVYLLELRPGEEQWDGFLLDRNQLIPTSRETWEGVKVVLAAVMKRVQRQTAIPRPTAPPPTTTSPAPVFWSTTTTRQMFGRFPQQHQMPNPSLRGNLHSRLNDLRVQQLKARRDYELRVSRQRALERQRKQQQLSSQLVRQQSAPVQTCFDLSRWCYSWIQNSPNICSTSTIYMQKDCARSCGFCR